MDFDFATYLNQLDATYIYRVEKLAGGVVNVTVRASKSRIATTATITASPSPTMCESRNDNAGLDCDCGCDCGQGRFPGEKSLILKHAPPFIAGVGESAPMSQSRQEVEAASLALFSPDPLPEGDRSRSLSSPSTQGVLHHVSTESGVMVPRLLHHDPANHVLVLSDLGPLPDLSKVFIELGGFTPDSAGAASWQPPPSSPRLGFPLEAHEISTYRRIGEKLGMFFTRLHDTSSIRSILGAAGHEQGEVLLRNRSGQQSLRADTSVFPSVPEMKTVIHEHVIKPIRSHLLKFPSLLDEAEAEILFAAVEADFLRPTPPEEQGVVLGDCWTGAVLVDLRPATGEDVDVGMGVIDWEFSSLHGRGVNGDVSQFLAHLELLRVAAHAHPNGQAIGHLSAINAIIEGFVRKYKLGQTKSSEDDCGLLRSAYLSHGAEIINCAFWKTWTCHDPECPSCTMTSQPSSCSSSASGQSGSTQCSVITKLVSRGISFLRCAVATEPPRLGTAALRQNIAANNLEMAYDNTQTKGLYDLFE
ncbi:uncharacterized protein Z519_04262 [Cladophialophora bantiana CBS 173.52]|uniref:Aminoglycoside phosphotransferase domain-containing protein n=1 Tax=Cladophialophora bantiana (strain ATCC 10958 / CBS 173.52 / CDC B-1940 / NIH 8579) TaxID=1442370 RepID=A0A0D2GAR3_CLAB1|nr:uncharacterized protein Z519_04262 [Cladophialophora bantiana CBS 173.52]KIW95677.1 hypothetical protein Z519_04262 [Cladophialophora bantiana CBS 173.52]